MDGASDLYAFSDAFASAFVLVLGFASSALRRLGLCPLLMLLDQWLVNMALELSQPTNMYKPRTRYRWDVQILTKTHGNYVGSAGKRCIFP